MICSFLSRLFSFHIFLFLPSISCIWHLHIYCISHRSSVLSFFPSFERLFTQSFTLVDDHFCFSIILLILSILLDLLYSTLLSAGLHRQHCYSHTPFPLLSSLFAFRPVLLFHDCHVFSFHFTVYGFMSLFSIYVPLTTLEWPSHDHNNEHFLD